MTMFTHQGPIVITVRQQCTTYKRFVSMIPFINPPMQGARIQLTDKEIDACIGGRLLGKDKRHISSTF